MVLVAVALTVRATYVPRQAKEKTTPATSTRDTPQVTASSQENNAEGSPAVEKSQSSTAPKQQVAGVPQPPTQTSINHQNTPPAPTCSQSTINTSVAYLTQLRSSSNTNVELYMAGYRATHPGATWGNPQYEAYYSGLIAEKNSWITNEVNRINNQNAQYGCAAIPNTFLL